MKLNTRSSRVWILGSTLCAMGVAFSAAAAALEAHIAIRPLTPTEISAYQLAGLQGASGLNTIGLGQPAYLEALANIDLAAGDITNVTWAITTAPVGSSAALEQSPLGAEVPTYKMAERLLYQVAGRTLLRPDVVGEYVVTATVNSASNGSTNVTQTLNAGTYTGVNTCALCHSGGIIAPDKVTPWSSTGHASFFTKAIDGLESDHYGANCISCHTVGHDTSTNAVNDGFDDIAKNVGWTFPAQLTNGNWAAMPKALQNVSNIQCENCHGPGSLHANSLGIKSKISVDLSAGDCAQCHDAMTHHSHSEEWNNSKHAIAVEETEAGCSRCHTAQGFANYVGGKPAVAVPYEVITCSTCHEPHDAANPHQVRAMGPVTLMDKTTTITEGGTGLVCMNCHMSRRDAKSYAETTAGSNRFGPHHGPQADMLAGANAYTYDQVIPSSGHKDVVEDSCVTCHMQPVAATSPAFTKAGAHTFNPTWEGDSTNGPVHLVGACIECHGEIESFDFPRQDYDGDGVVAGVQTEVKNLLNKLALQFPPVGVEKPLSVDLGITTNWTRAQLKGAYNYLFVLEDGSFGVHNLSYAVGLLKASIADLTGDANNDTLPDSWQIQYFGSISNPDAAPNATPAGDGIPNWLKYSLGLDPMVAGAAIPNGVVWASGKDLVNPPIDPGATNTVVIYTAAEIVFNTEVGTSYQIQSCSEVSGGWVSVGDAIAGTGSPISYVTPTRKNVQQFYRVVETK